MRKRSNIKWKELLVKVTVYFQWKITVWSRRFFENGFTWKVLRSESVCEYANILTYPTWLYNSKQTDALRNDVQYLIFQIVRIKFQHQEALQKRNLKYVWQKEKQAQIKKATYPFRNNENKKWWNRKWNNQILRIIKKQDLSDTREKVRT